MSKFGFGFFNRRREEPLNSWPKAVYIYGAVFIYMYVAKDILCDVYIVFPAQALN